MKIIPIILFLFSIFSIQAQEIPNTFALEGNILATNKYKIAKKDGDLLPAYQQLIKSPDKLLEEETHSVMEKTMTPPSGDKHDYISLAPYFWPDTSKPGGLPYIRKDGQTNPEVKNYSDKNYIISTCNAIQTLTLAYYFSGEQKYAEKAAYFIRVWFLNKKTKMNPNFNYAQMIKGVNDGRGAGLIDARHFIHVIDGIQLLQSSKHWKSEDQQGMHQWFSDFLTWMQTSENGMSEMKAKNNHGTYYDALRLSLSLFLDNKKDAENIVRNAELRLDAQMDDEGQFPLEMLRTISLHYSSFDLYAFSIIANMSKHVNIDFWNYTSESGKSIKKAFDFQYPYLAEKKEWFGEQIKPFDFCEDAIPVLLLAANNLECSDCVKDVKNIVAKNPKNKQLKDLLIY